MKRTSPPQTLLPPTMPLAGRRRRRKAAAPWPLPAWVWPRASTAKTVRRQLRRVSFAILCICLLEAVVWASATASSVGGGGVADDGAQRIFEEKVSRFQATFGSAQACGGEAGHEASTDNINIHCSNGNNSSALAGAAEAQAQTSRSAVETGGVRSNSRRDALSSASAAAGGQASGQRRVGRRALAPRHGGHKKSSKKGGDELLPALGLLLLWGAAVAAGTAQRGRASGCMRSALVLGVVVLACSLGTVAAAGDTNVADGNSDGHGDATAPPDAPDDYYSRSSFYRACVCGMLLVLLTGPLAVLSSILAPVWAIICPPPLNPRPPRWAVLFPALRGKFNLEAMGPVECLRQAYNSCGEIFRIHLPFQPVTFLIGPRACEFWFKQPNDVFNPAGAYRAFMKPVFGPRVVYDAPWERMASQLRFVKHGLSHEMMTQHPAKLVREITEYCDAEEAGWLAQGEVELYHMTSELIINTASRCILGDEIRDTVHKEFAGLYMALEQGISHLSFFAPWLPTAAHRKRDAARAALSRLFTPIIQARRKRTEKSKKGTSVGSGDVERPNDFLQVLVDGEYRDGTKPDDEAIVGLLVAALFGGQHTSNITTSWLLMMITDPKNQRTGTATDKPPLLSRLLAEQEAVKATHGDKITFAALQDMPLLDNCVKETLRLFPPLIVLMRKVLTPVAYTMEDGMNYTIPKGDIVCISAAVQNRLPELFTDPHSFNPDRHGGTYPGALGTEAAETACRGVQLVDNKSKWIPFGGGRHACVGRYFAFMQIKTIVSIFLARYELEWRDPGWKPNIDFTQIVATPPPCPVKIKARKK